MQFELVPAIVAGLGAGVAMEAMPLMMKVTGPRMHMDMLVTWGAMFHLRGAAAQVVGFLMHQMLSALVGVGYALGFVVVGVEDQVLLWGVFGALIHWVIAGFFLGLLPGMHPEMPEVLPAPGIFARHHAMPDVPGFLVAHLLYGIGFAVFYALLHSAGGVEVLF